MPAIKERKFFRPELTVRVGVYDREEYAASVASTPAQSTVRPSRVAAGGGNPS